MTRRFLTASDVRRLGGPTIQLEPETVVTYQARELAESLGIALQSEGGIYVEPAPDRGPDAERAQESLPQLPEPADDTAALSAAVVTAVGRNRAGVLAEITGAIGAVGGDVQEISQRTVEGMFHLILTVQLPPGVAFGDLQGCLGCLGGNEDYVVRVMHERVFRYMHRV